MTRLVGSLGMTLAALSAGCPPHTPSPQAPVATPAGAGCPSPEAIYVASYLTRDPADASDPAPSHTGWVLPLHHRKIDAITDQPDYTAIDAQTAGSLGVPVVPPAVWLIVPGQAPCRATIGSYYAAAVDAPPNITYGVELSGCAAPPADQQEAAQAIALASELAPTECQILAPRPVAARLGETDAQNQWQRPTKETAIPPALAAAIPSKDCRLPECETLWAVAEVSVAGRPVAWAGAVNWLKVSPAAACEWPVETFAGFFVAGPDGRATKVSEASSLLLGAVLADRSGPRALVAEGAGEYAVYELVNGAARLARRAVWLLAPPEDYAVDERIGPVCTPPAAR